MLLLPLCGSIATVLLFWSLLAQTASAPAHINLAGHQRMLAVQLGDWAGMVASGQDEDRPRLRDLIDTYERSLVALERGGKINGRDIVPLPEGPRAEAARVRALWEDLRSRLQVIAEHPAGSPESERAASDLGSAVEALRSGADAMTGALETRLEMLHRRMQWILAGGLGLNLFLLLLGLWYVRRYIIKPVFLLDAAAKRFTSGDYSVRLVCKTRDELCDLAETFNEMAGRVQSLLVSIDQRRRHAETLAESLPLGTALLDGDLAVVRTNRSFREIFGQTEAEIHGRRIHEILPVAGLSERLLPVIGNGDPVERFDTDIQIAAGIRHLRISATGTRLAEEEEARLLLVVEDLTEQARLARTVAEQETYWRDTFGAISDAIYVHDTEFKIVRANATAVALAGASSEAEIAGRPYFEALGLGDAPLPTCLEAQATRRTMSEEYHDASTGRRYDIESHPLVRGADKYIGAVHVHRDITERHRSEEALRRSSEESFRSLIEWSPEAIAVHRDGRFVYANPALVSSLGYEATEDLIGTPVLDIIHPDDREAVATRVQTMLATGEPAPSAEERFLRRDGAVITAEVVALKLLFRGDPAVVVIARDVSERKNVMAKMMEMDRMIAVGILAAGVGHEINNPLSYVIANLDLLAEELPRVVEGCRAHQGALAPFADHVPGPAAVSMELGELVEMLDEARQGAARVRNIVRDLKTLSRADKEHRGLVDVRRLLELSINMAWNEIRHRARLIKDYGEIPPIEANEARLGQVFINLLVNAAQAIPEGAADTNTIQVRTRRDGDRVVVEVEDSGAGIPEEHRRRLFEPFFTTKPVGQGTGLGLAICRQTVESHGGEIAVESRVGRGTIFRVMLPAAPVPEPASAAPAAPMAAATSRRGRILVVDDEPMIVRTLQRALAADHDIVALTSAREAKDRLASGERFDIIFCDLMMPEMTGMELHAELLAATPEQAEKMIFLTGGAFTPRASEFLDAVPNQRIDKPFDMRNLRALVRDLLK